MIPFRDSGITDDTSDLFIQIVNVSNQDRSIGLCLQLSKSGNEEGRFDDALEPVGYPSADTDALRYINQLALAIH